MPLRHCFFLLAVLLTGCGRSGQGEPILIGHLAPLQSADKTRFEHARQGMSLAIEELNQQPSPALARKFEVLHVNTDEDLDQLQASAVRLLTVNRAIALVGGTDAAQLERLTRAAQPYEAALLTGAMTSPSLASDFLFSLEPSPARVAKIVSRWLTETLHGDVLAFAYDARSPVAAALATALRAELQPTDKGRVVEVPFDSQPKFNELCDSFGKSKAKAWLFFGKSDDWVGIRRALRESSSKIPSLVLDGVGPIEALPATLDLEGAVYQVTTYFVSEQAAASAAFQANFAKRFHMDPDLYAAQGYEAVRLISEASAAGKTNLAGKPAVELNNFIKLPFNSCTGALWFDPAEHSANRPLFLLKKTDKQPALILKIDAVPPTPPTPTP
jgi:ABC-type branched-subunit amino acid transport system substrate-binding protein